MSAPVDVAKLRGGPLQRYGGKGRNAPRIVPHFARAFAFADACVGAGGVLFALPASVYPRRAVNDADGRLIGFFRVLRDRPEELERACALTPYSLAEFTAALARSDDPVEDARRVWVLGRQGFGGKAKTPGDWGRNPKQAAGRHAIWNPSKAVAKLDALHVYARSLLDVAIDCIDGAAFVDKWGQPGTMVYVDPPYVAATRKGARDYLHELDDAGHRRFAVACHGAVARGAKVCVSGYASDLYADLYAGWRRVDLDVALHGTRHASGQRRTESLWMSYPAADEIGAGPLALAEGAPE